MNIENYQYAKNHFQKFSYLYMIIIFIGFMAMVILNGVLGDLFAPIKDIKQLSLNTALIRVLIAAIITFIFYMMINLFFNKIKFSTIKILSLNRTMLKTVILSIIITAVMLYIIALLLYFKYHDTKYFLLLFYSPLPYIIVQLPAAFLEEFIFRGLMLNFFVQSNKKYLGLIIISSFFGLIHITNIFFGQQVSFLLIFNALSGGFLLGLIYLDFGLFSAIIVHFLWNASTSQLKIENELFATIVVFAVCIPLFIYERALSKKKLA